MRQLKHLFEQNRNWVAGVTANDPQFFNRLAQQQKPEILWIGCADSRVPANQVVGMLPGDIFVHRNIANMVIHTDLNCLSVLQYAVDVLKVKHVIVCGHYNCGGVRGALQQKRLGLIDNWLQHIFDIYEKHRGFLDSAEHQTSRLCELNVIEQVLNLSQTSIVRDAWERGQELALHGWIYDVADGLLRDLEMSLSAEAESRPFYKAAVGRVVSGDVFK